MTVACDFVFIECSVMLNSNLAEFVSAFEYVGQLFETLSRSVGVMLNYIIIYFQDAVGCIY